VVKVETLSYYFTVIIRLSTVFVPRTQYYITRQKATR